jgi:hypothetical protein
VLLSSSVAAAFQWQINRTGRGDFLVLRTEKADAYNQWIMDLSNDKDGQVSNKNK